MLNCLHFFLFPSCFGRTDPALSLNIWSVHCGQLCLLVCSRTGDGHSFCLFFVYYVSAFWLILCLLVCVLCILPLRVGAEHG